MASRDSQVRVAVRSAFGGKSVYSNYRQLAKAASAYASGVTEAEAKKAVAQLRQDGFIAQGNTPIRRA